MYNENIDSKQLKLRSFLLERIFEQSKHLRVWFGAWFVILPESRGFSGTDVKQPREEKKKKIEERGNKIQAVSQSVSEALMKEDRATLNGNGTVVGLSVGQGRQLTC